MLSRVTVMLSRTTVMRSRMTVMLSNDSDIKVMLISVTDTNQKGSDAKQSDSDA